MDEVLLERDAGVMMRHGRGQRDPKGANRAESTLSDTQNNILGREGRWRVSCRLVRARLLQAARPYQRWTRILMFRLSELDVARECASRQTASGFLL